MPLGSIASGLIGQSGSQAGGDMAWNGAVQGSQQAQKAAELAANQRHENLANSSPWTGSGITALGQISKLLGMGTLGPNENGIYYVKPFGSPDEARTEAANAFVKSPGYQFRMDEGIKARDRSAAARGMVLSGAQSKAIDTYGQNVASEEYNNYLGNLFNLAGMGQGAMSSNMGANTNLTGVGANALVSGGNMLASGAALRGSAYERGANSLASGINSGMQNAFTLDSMYGWGRGGWSGSDSTPIKTNSGGYP